VINISRCTPPFKVIIALLTVLSVSTSRAGVTTEERFIYYDISGNTASELRASINSHTRNFKNRFDAATQWKITWQFGYKPRQKKCKITEVNIEASIDYVLPRWLGASEHPNKQLVKQWQNFRTQLLAHEKQHGAFVKAATLEVERRIITADDTSFAPPNCKKLQKRANRRAQSVITKLEMQHKTFDRETNHGRSTGASFP
jgi:predicted secreted Zn-dependent protease